MEDMLARSAAIKNLFFMVSLLERVIPRLHCCTRDTKTQHTVSTAQHHRATAGSAAAHARLAGSASPARRDETPLTIARERDVGRVELDAIPQLAGDLLVLLVERLAVVRELAAPDLAAATLADLQPPVRLGQADATRSASPRSRSASACANSQMPPAATTGVARPAARTAPRIVPAIDAFRANGPRASE